MKSTAPILGERAFTEMEFASPEASLAGLNLGSSLLPIAFVPSQLTYDLGSISSLPPSVTFTTTASRSGQYLEYSWNGAGHGDEELYRV